MPRPSITFITGQYVPRCTHDIDKHFSAYQTLQYMDAGHVWLRVGEREYALNGRFFWSAYPGPRIAFHAAPPAKTWVHRYLAFRGPLVQRWMEDGLFPVPPQEAPAGVSFASRFDVAMKLALSPGRWSSVRAAHAVEGMLIDLAEARQAAPAAPAWVSAVTRELADASEPVDYDALSQRLGLSVRSLRRNFRKRLGTTPHQYVIAQRVQSARDLLLKTDTPLKEIARQLGYADVFYFARQFKRQTGVSPAMFRRSREG